MAARRAAKSVSPLARGGEGALADASVPQVEARLGTLLSSPPDPAIAKVALTVLADPRFRAREQLGAPAMAVGVALLHGATATKFDALPRHKGLNPDIARWNHLVLEAAASLRRKPKPPGKSTDTAPLPRAPLKALHAAWITRAKTRSPATLDSLLEVLGIGPATDVTERALTLLSFPRDERIADAVAALLTKPSVRSDVSVPFFAVLGMTLVAHGSRVHRAAAEALTAAIPTLRWIELLLPDVAPTTRAPTKSKNAAPDSEATFLTWLAEAPSDLDRRHLFADWLLEKEKPRGEHLSLQLAALTRALDAKEHKRIAALEKKHAAEWLQPLGKGVMRRFAKFRGGVLTELRVHAWRPAEVPESNDPQLATVADLALEGGTNLPLDAFIREARLPSLRALSLPSRLLPALPETLMAQLETLSAGIDFRGTVAELLALLDRMKLPALHSLNLWGRSSPADLGALLNSQVVKRVASLGLEIWERLAAFEALRELPQLRSLSLFQPAHLETLDAGSSFTLTRAERWSLAVWARAPASGDFESWFAREVLDRVAQLDPGVRETATLTFETKPPLPAPIQRRLADRVRRI